MLCPDDRHVLTQPIGPRGGKLHPYQEGELGVVQEGAYADLLRVDGNPLEDIEVMVNPEENLDLIMKNGVIYKHTKGE